MGKATASFPSQERGQGCGITQHAPLGKCATGSGPATWSPPLGQTFPHWKTQEGFLQTDQSTAAPGPEGGLSEGHKIVWGPHPVPLSSRDAVLPAESALHSEVGVRPP